MSKFPAYLQISLSALAQNYRIVKSMGSAAVAPVLKADGYGTGAIQAFQALHKEGARQFFVATPEEAAELRSLSNDVEIFILGGFYKGADQDYIQGGFTPVLNSIEEIARWAALSKTAGRKLPAAIHFDTGMNRLGLGKDETQKLITDPSLLGGIDLRLIMSHFACSDEKDHDMNARQAAIFAKIATAFPRVPKSLCNSSGVFRDKNWHYDLLRPGFCLYGGNPTPETTNPMRSVVELSVRILQTRCVKAGENAGYGASHMFQIDTSLATVALGYADGFHRAGRNTAKLYWNGQPCPIVGRVSMDLIIVDTGGIKGAKPETGDLLEVLGPHQSVDQLAADCGTIGYEILTSLGKRYVRTYI
jgi:alanine racemase